MNLCKDQHIVTIMQVRRNSSRLPDKVLLPLKGEFLFFRQLERIMSCTLTGTVVVATTTSKADDVVAEFCGQKKIPCFRGHPFDLLDRHYKAAELYGANIVVKIPSDCPLIDPAIIDKVIQFFLDNKNELDYASNLHPATYPDGNDVEIMHFKALENAWVNAVEGFEREHTTPYIWERPDKFRIGNVAMRHGQDYSLKHRWTIDYPEDYEFINKVYNHLYPLNSFFGMEQVLALINEHPEIYNINNHLVGLNWYRHHLDQLKTIDALQTKIYD